MKLEQWLSTLTTWELIKLVLVLGFVAGTLAGLTIGMYYQQERIVTTLNTVAWQPENLIRANDQVYMVTPVLVTCLPFKLNVTCTVIAERDNVLLFTKVFPVVKNEDR